MDSLGFLEKLCERDKRGLCESHPQKNKVYPKCENTDRKSGRCENTGSRGRSLSGVGKTLLGMINKANSKAEAPFGVLLVKGKEVRWGN